MHRLLNPSKVCGMSFVKKIVLEVVKSHVHQFLLGKLLLPFEGESPPSCSEVCYGLSFRCFFSINSATNSPLGIADCLRNSCSTVCELMTEPLGRFANHVKAAPSIESIKSYDNGASLTISWKSYSRLFDGFPLTVAAIDHFQHLAHAGPLLCCSLGLPRS